MCANNGFPRVIAFFGPDGAGKSTQARLVIDYLRAKGFRVKRAWVRSTHTFAYLLWMVFYKLNLLEDRSGLLKTMRLGFAVSYLRESPYGAVSPITLSPPILKGSFSRKVWAAIEVISVLPVITIQVYLPLLLGRIVVAERFVVDSIAGIAYFLGDENFCEGWYAKFLLRLVPIGTFFVFVDADYETILASRKHVAGPREYTEFHRRAFERFVGVVSALYVNTSKLSIQEAYKCIVNLLESKMGQ